MSTSFFARESKTPEAVRAQLERLKSFDPDIKPGRDFKLVLTAAKQAKESLREELRPYFFQQAGDPWNYRFLRNIEHELVRMCAEIFHGDRHVVGLMTYDPAETMLLVMKTYKEKFRKARPWVRRPEIIVPESANPAVLKASELLEIKVRFARLSPDFRVDLASVRKLINRNSMLIVGSAPQYSQGVIDPLAQLGELALKHGVPLHVDAAYGGFIIPFLEKLGSSVPAFDFRIPGVMSLSADLDKYAFGFPGTGVLLYRSMNLMKHQFFISTQRSVHTSVGILGARPAYPLVEAWFHFQELGEEGFLGETKKILSMREEFLQGIAAISELKLVEHPDASLVAVTTTTDVVGVDELHAALKEKGWLIERLAFPHALHFTLAPGQSASVKELLKDLKEAVTQLRTTGLTKSGVHTELSRSALSAQMEKMFGPQNAWPDPGLRMTSWLDYARVYGSSVQEILGSVRNFFRG